MWSLTGKTPQEVLVTPWGTANCSTSAGPPRGRGRLALTISRGPVGGLGPLAWAWGWGWGWEAGPDTAPALLRSQ